MKRHTFYLILGLVGTSLIVFDVQFLGFHIGYFVNGFALGSLWAEVDKKVRKK